MGRVVFIRAMKAYRGSIGITPLILNLVRSMEMNTQHHVLANLSLRKEPPPPAYVLDKRTGGSQNRYGQFTEGKNLLKGRNY
jgi:hypothetical protein